MLIILIIINIKESFNLSDDTSVLTNTDCNSGDIDISDINTTIRDYMIENNTNIREQNYYNNLDFISNILCNNEDIIGDKIKCISNNSESCKIVDFCNKVNQCDYNSDFLNIYEVDNNITNNYHINNLNFSSILSSNNISPCDDPTVTTTDTCYKNISNIYDINNCLEYCNEEHDCIASFIYPGMGCVRYLQNTPNSDYQYVIDPNNTYYIKNSYLNRNILPNFTLNNLIIKGGANGPVLYEFHNLNDAHINLDLDINSYNRMFTITIDHPDIQNYIIKYNNYLEDDSISSEMQDALVIDVNNFKINTTNQDRSVKVYIQLYNNNNEIFFMTLNVNLINN